MLETKQWRTRGLRAAIIVTVLVVAISGVSSVGLAQEDGPPEPPHRVYGDLTDNGEPIADGTITVIYDGEVIESETTDEDGYYDLQVEDPSENSEDEDLTVEYGNDSGASGSFVWSSASSTEIDLNVDDDGDSDGGDTGDDGNDGDSNGGDTGGAGVGGNSNGGDIGDGGEGTATQTPKSTETATPTAAETLETTTAPGTTTEVTTQPPEDDGFDPVTLGGIVLAIVILVGVGYSLFVRR